MAMAEVPVEALRALVDALRPSGVEEFERKEAAVKAYAESHPFEPEEDLFDTGYDYALHRETRGQVRLWALAAPLAACLPEARSDA